jgi:septin 7
VSSGQDGHSRVSHSESAHSNRVSIANGKENENPDDRAYPGSLHRNQRAYAVPGQFRSMLDIEDTRRRKAIDSPHDSSTESPVERSPIQAARDSNSTLSDQANDSSSTAANGATSAAPTRAPAPVPNGKAVSPAPEIPQSVSSADPKVAAQQASDMRNVVRRKLTGYVGFANLPNQWHRKSVRKGFNFNVMVVGESGLGKSTLVNTLFNSSLYPPRERKGPSLDIIPKTVSIQSISADIEESGVRLRLTVVDTPGFGDFVNNDESWRPIVDNIEQRFDAYLDAENKVNRMNIVDNRVHACVYFIQPTGHALKPLDIEVMRRLHTKVNLIPVIAKADTMTDEEILAFKSRVSSHVFYV